VPFGQVEVVHPPRGVDPGTRRVLVDVEDLYLFVAIGFRDLGTAAGPGGLHQRHGAHVAELTDPVVVGPDNPFGELGVQGALHPGAVARVVPFDVVQRRLANPARVGRRGLGAGDG